MGERLYIVPTWVGAASDQYHGGAGIRRRDGGGSVGLSYDKSTGEIYSETDLYKPNGKANLDLFREKGPSEVDQALDYLEEFLLKKRQTFRKCDEALAILDDIAGDITKEDFRRLHYNLEAMKQRAYRASLPEFERDKIEAEEGLEYVKANADKFPLLALSLGIQPSSQVVRQLEREGFLAPSSGLSIVEWWELAKTVGGWAIVVLIAWKIFSI